MTKKETAERLRKLDETGNWGGVQALADTLDPPRPEPGTVVWVRWSDSQQWRLAEVDETGGVELFGTVADFPLEELEWKLARILAPDEVSIPIGVAKAIIGEDSQYNRQLPAAFAVEARATRQNEIPRAEGER